MVFFLTNQVWNKGHEARALNRVGQLSLVPSAYARTLARHDLAERRQVATKSVRVLVVDFLNVHLTEEALTIDVFFHRLVSKRLESLVLCSGRVSEYL